jgi:hypothetical protein
MENEKLQNQENDLRYKENSKLELIFKIISYISWLLLLVNGCVSLRWLYKKKYMRVWTISVIKKYEYVPLQMYHIIIYLVFNFFIIILSFGCAYFFMATLFQKNNDTINKLFKIPVSFNFFPILCAFIMFILGELKAEETKEINSIVRAGFAISLIGLISMIFIYISTEFDKENWISNLLIKKGVFSALIILFWYNTCYDIFYLHKALRPTGKKIFNWMKGCGLAFSIIFGLGSNIFSFWYKDIIICIFNLLIYIGLAIFYYKYEAKTFNWSYYYYYEQYSAYNYRYYSFNDKKNKGDGIVDIIMICISIFLLIYLIAYHMKNIKDEAMKNIDDIKTQIDNLKKENEIKIKNAQKEIGIIITDRKQAVDKSIITNNQ